MPTCKKHYVYYDTSTGGYCLDCYAMECEQIRADIAKLTEERDARRISQAFKPSSTPVQSCAPKSLGQIHYEWCVRQVMPNHNPRGWDTMDKLTQAFWDSRALQEVDLANATGHYEPWMPAPAPSTTAAPGDIDDNCVFDYMYGGGFNLPHTD